MNEDALVYFRTGYCAWRDSQEPTRILEDLCEKYNLSPPEYTETSVRIGCKEFPATQKVGEVYSSAR